MKLIEKLGLAAIVAAGCGFLWSRLAQADIFWWIWR